MAVVLIPLDASKWSEYAIDFYLKHLHKEGNSVHTCYVADYFGNVGVLDGGPSPGRIKELEEEDKRKAAAIEAGVGKIFEAQRIESRFTRLTGKEPWQKIIEYSRAVHASLIVMGSRGLGTLRRTILGSVSESVLHHSDVPVVICKMPDDKHKHHHHQQQQHK